MTKERNATIRQQVIDELAQGPQTLRDLSQAVGIMEKDVVAHLPFIEKSLRHQGKKLKSRPYECLSCGFIFEGRKKYSKPGKCPSCRKERIDQACFWIE